MADILDPNAHLPDHVVQCGLRGVSFAFQQCKMEPRHVETEEGCNSLLFGELNGKRFVVYVRITLEEENENGTGPIPRILIDTARDIEAEPHLIRVHMKKEGKGFGLTYFGYNEFIDAVRLSAES
jgi:hypothetical protein